MDKISLLKKILLLLTAVLCLNACASRATGFFMGDKIDVTIKIQDESGKPIPYVTVWQFVMPESEHVSSIAGNPNMDDLLRVTRRYSDTAEYVVRYGEKPIEEFIIHGMGDENGLAKSTLNYQWYTGEGNDFKRPDPTNFGFTFIKHGYLPEKIEFDVPRGENKVDATIVLKRNPNREIEIAPYVQEYERIRYLLSDTSKDEGLIKSNQIRIAELEKMLETAAQQAIAAGDKKAAARIYIRMRYMPEVVLSDRVVSYRHVNRKSERSRRVWALAKQLDPDNLFVQMFSVYDGYEDDFNDLTISKDELYKNKLAEIEKIIQKHGLAIWPQLYVWRADLYLKLNQREKAKLLYNEIMEIEPKYYDWDVLLKYKNFEKKKELTE